MGKYEVPSDEKELGEEKGVEFGRIWGAKKGMCEIQWAGWRRMDGGEREKWLWEAV